jgi:tetraacyldisaccharide 4'-kinase
VISTLYAALARRRREWYASRPQRRQRLRRPVISVGNLAVGGRGKTPFTATVARLLLEQGEVPAILSRGYGRTDDADPVVIVRDRDGLRSDVSRSGDEPFMLARQLPGTIVVAGPDRYRSGSLAEAELGATVHVLDDGFQHLQLDRDADIVLVSAADLRDATTLPGGRLREPPDVLIAADAIVCVDDEAHVEIPDVPVFRGKRSSGSIVFGDGTAGARSPGPALALAGIADPAPFVAAVEHAGWKVAAARVFRDHHPYSAADVRRLAEEAAAAGAVAIVTTEKDYVRLLRHRPFRIPVGFLPLTMTPEPLDDFRRWLASAVAGARDIVIA